MVAGGSEKRGVDGGLLMNEGGSGRVTGTLNKRDAIRIGAEDREGIIGAAIIVNDDFIGGLGLLQGGIDAFPEPRTIVEIIDEDGRAHWFYGSGLPDDEAGKQVADIFWSYFT